MAPKAKAGSFKSDEECAHALGKLQDEPSEQIQRACAPNPDHFKRLGRPRKGDWLWEHKETGQMFSSYRRKMDPVRRPGKRTHTILLVPMGKTFKDGIAQKFMQYIIEYCRAFFDGMEVECLAKPLSLKDISRRENDFEDGQYLISELFELLNTHKDVRSHPSYLNAYCRLGITMEDIYPGEDWSYVFGQAKPLERVGVFSFARHSPLFYDGVHASDAANQLSAKQLVVWLRACLRTMVHETGHMFGILHCVYYQCLMNGSNGPGDTAGRSSFLCPICLRKLFFALSDVSAKGTALSRYSAMLQVLLSIAKDLCPSRSLDSDALGSGLANDISWLAQRIRLLGGDPTPELEFAANAAALTVVDSDDLPDQTNGYEATNGAKVPVEVSMEGQAWAPVTAPVFPAQISAAQDEVNIDDLVDGAPLHRELVRCVSDPLEASEMASEAHGQLLSIFREWDITGDGVITESELRRVLVASGVSEADVSGIVPAAAVGGDGKVDYEEFVNWLYCSVPGQVHPQSADVSSTQGSEAPAAAAAAIGKTPAAQGVSRCESSTIPSSAVEAACGTPATFLPRRGGAFSVNTCQCVGKNAKDLFSAVAAGLGWKEVDVEARPGGTWKKTRKRTIYCVMQTADLMDRLPQVSSGSWISRIPGMPDICDKGNFARMVNACSDLTEEGAWRFVPKTWVLPDDLDKLRGVLGNNTSKKTYIVKPEDGSQGDGIFMVQGLRDFEVKISTKPNVAAVCQRYLEKPLLLSGFKFDLRIYVLFAGGNSVNPIDNPISAFLCKEGLARFCTEQYVEPSQQNLHKCMGHLTNYSLNKQSANFVHAGEDMSAIMDPGSGASKRPMTAVLKQLASENKGFSVDKFYESLAKMIETSACAMTPILSASHRNCQVGSEIRCFQLLGFDVMLTHKFEPYLLEVNNSPSLCIDEVFPLEPGEEVGNAPKGKRNTDKDKPCLCMDMQGPHRHQNSVVDTFVKSTAMAGAFRILEQLNDGTDPEDDMYINVNVDEDDTGLHDLLCQAATLFERCGGPAKAFSSSAMRRHLAPLAGHGNLQKHDFDTTSQRMRNAGTSFVGHERNAGLQPQLRLFEFISMLRQLGARAFPGQTPRATLESVLSVVL